MEKDKEKPKGIKGIIKEYFNTSLLIGMAIAGLLAFAELKLRMFSSPEVRVLTEEHMKVDVDPVYISRLSDTLKKQQGEALILKEEGIKAIKDQTNMFDSLVGVKIKKDSFDIADALRKAISRAKRDSVNVLTLKALEKIVEDMKDTKDDIEDIKVEQRNQGKDLDSLKLNN